MVQAGGVAGGSSDRKGLWILLLTFEAWKYADDNIQNGKLTIRKEVTEKELNSVMKEFAPYDCVRVRARVAEQNAFGKPQGLLVEIIGKDSDADLRRCALELQKPVTYRDERFGVFTLDRRVNWYEAEISWASKNIRLSLSTDESKEIKQSLALAQALWNSQRDWSERIAEYAVTKLLDLKNDTWLGEDEEELSREQFKSKMSLNSITVNPNGSFEFWYDDGDLFWGHSIRVSGTLSEGPNDAGIEG
ncbi:MAG: DUF2262 domain-containing protein [Verrucomicrobia bacterium]|nr:DUF2262 domain-containing protein [Verrucomicrobiota bacterium]